MTEAKRVLSFRCIFKGIKSQIDEFSSTIKDLNH